MEEVNPARYPWEREALALERGPISSKDYFRSVGLNDPFWGT